MRLLSRVFAVALVVGGAAPAVEARAQKGPGGDAVVTLRVCNNTGRAARVAISYQPVGRNTFYNEGWFEVGARSCEDLARTSNAYMYGYANVAGDTLSVWSGDHALCVEYPGPYAFWTTGSPYCETHQESVDFQVLQATTSGVFTWNLDP